MEICAASYLCATAHGDVVNRQTLGWWWERKGVRGRHIGGGEITDRPSARRCSDRFEFLPHRLKIGSDCGGP
jgi:hypothetical protein